MIEKILHGSLEDIMPTLDEKLDCIFADTEKIGLPINGIVCGSFGVIQSGDIRPSGPRKLFS